MGGFVEEGIQGEEEKKRWGKRTEDNGRGKADDT